jgi:hypothetical protein
MIRFVAEAHYKIGLAYLCEMNKSAAKERCDTQWVLRNSNASVLVAVVSRAPPT